MASRVDRENDELHSHKSKDLRVFLKKGLKNPCKLVLMARGSDTGPSSFTKKNYLSSWLLEIPTIVKSSKELLFSLLCYVSHLGTLPPNKYTFTL